MENKQTAVEWLIEHIQKQVDAGYGFNSRYDQKLLDQAKQIEKQQIVDAVDGHPIQNRHLDGEQYYSETYQSTEPI